MIRFHVSPRRRNRIAGIIALAISLACGAPAAGQFPMGMLDGPGVPILPDLAGGLPNIAGGAPGDVQATSEMVRRDLIAQLVKARRDVLDVDDHGEMVVRGEVLALAPTPETLDRARANGFVVISDDTDPQLGLHLVTLRPPRDVSARRALKQIRALDPGGVFDLDHILLPGGAPGGPAPPTQPERPEIAAGARIGMIDGGVETTHPALADTKIDQRGFAGAAIASEHGTAVASLLVGRGPGLAGAAVGARLYAADVYGATPTGGNARSILAAMSWFAALRVGVINVSLVGPDDAVIRAGVNALIARGVVVVAPVGNDGPAAPPLYPASYAGVVAVTAVDRRGRVLPEAGRARHVDFAAPGEVRAAVTGGYGPVRGTSFAAPVVAGMLAHYLPVADPADARDAVARLGRSAIDLGPSGGGRLRVLGLTPRAGATTRK